LASGASVSLIARELNINSNQLFTWRKKFGDAALARGTVGHLVEVTVAKAPSATLPVGAAAETGVIVLSVDKAQLRLEGRADPATLALLLARLLP
jgi:transposase